MTDEELKTFEKRLLALEIYIMNIDGSEKTNLTNNLISDFHPVFQP